MMLGNRGWRNHVELGVRMPPDGEPLELLHQFWSDALQVPEPGVDPLPQRLVEVKLRRPAQAGRRRLERV